DRHGKAAPTPLSARRPARPPRADGERRGAALPRRGRDNAGGQPRAADAHDRRLGARRLLDVRRMRPGHGRAGGQRRAVPRAAQLRGRRMGERGGRLDRRTRTLGRRAGHRGDDGGAGVVRPDARAGRAADLLHDRAGERGVRADRGAAGLPGVPGSAAQGRTGAAVRAGAWRL
ncbi:MAG: hypothetical protein AVDCRST_MAG39-716, partial [uncultured Sphingomonadaceae bacterium]